MFVLKVISKVGRFISTWDFTLRKVLVATSFVSIADVPSEGGFRSAASVSSFILTCRSKAPQRVSWGFMLMILTSALSVTQAGRVLLSSQWFIIYWGCPCRCCHPRLWPGPGSAASYLLSSHLHTSFIERCCMFLSLRLAAVVVRTVSWCDRMLLAIAVRVCGQQGEPPNKDLVQLLPALWARVMLFCGLVRQRWLSKNIWRCILPLERTGATPSERGPITSSYRSVCHEGVTPVGWT